MTVLILQIILSVSAIIMAVLLIRASFRVQSMPSERIEEYSITPHIDKVKSSILNSIYEFLIAFFKGILHLLASLSKHTHLLSTRSIAKIEKAISNAEEEVEEIIQEELEEREENE